MASKALFISVSEGLSIQVSVTATVEHSIPTTVMEEEKFTQGVPIFRLFEATGLCASGSEARRLIEQGGGYLNKKRIDRFDYLVTHDDFVSKDGILLRAGKKKFHRIKIMEKMI